MNSTRPNRRSEERAVGIGGFQTLQPASLGAFIKEREAFRHFASALLTEIAADHVERVREQVAVQ